MIEDFYKLVPSHFKNMSGAVFNTGRSGFMSSSPLYMLGLNPGGNPETHQLETVDFHTEKVLKRPSEWSEFRDESWNNRKPGTAGMQPRILHMLRQLKIEPHRVPTSNVVFKRTSGEADIAEEFDALAAECWPVHEAVIERLNVKVVLCFGKRAGTWVRSRLGAHNEVGIFVENNKRNWVSHAHSNNSGVCVISATHPSRADWRNPASDPTPLLRQTLN